MLPVLILFDIIFTLGYELIGLLIRKRHWVLNEPLLHTLLEVVGITMKKGAQRSGVIMRNQCLGVVANLSAFKCWLLDWRIWRTASFGVQVPTI